MSVCLRDLISCTYPLYRQTKKKSFCNMYVNYACQLNECQLIILYNVNLIEIFLSGCLQHFCPFI